MSKSNVKSQVEIFGGLCATHEEMANWFNVSVRTIEREMAPVKDSDNNILLDENGDELMSEFCRVYKKSQAETKTSLRRTQMNKALTDKDTTLLIWLGKQLLGQRDKSEDIKTIKHMEISSEPLTEEQWEEEHGN
jgi:hypothetical protein